MPPRYCVKCSTASLSRRGPDGPSISQFAHLGKCDHVFVHQRGHAIEQEYGRVRTQPLGPRTLDVDLLAVDGEQVRSTALTLPHPRAHMRAFVLVPWAEVDPGFRLPGRGRVDELLAALPAADRAGVRPAGTT